MLVLWPNVPVCLVGAMGALLLLASGARAQTLDVVDFLANGRDLVGKTVTVTGCNFTAASTLGVLCSTRVASFTIDFRSLDRGDLHRALRQCSGIIAQPGCAGNVTGVVSPSSTTVVLKNAKIEWAPNK